MSSNSDNTANLWLRMLEASEAVAASNKEAIERSAAALERATEELGSTIAAQREYTSKLEELVALKMDVASAKESIKELQVESKAGKVGKGDLIWKIAVAVFALAASALGGSLLSILVKS